MIDAKLFSAIKKIEQQWDNVIAFAYREENNRYWILAIDDYDLYCSKEYKEFVEPYRQKVKREGGKVVFVYQNPSENLLVSLIDRGLILSNS